MYTFDLLTGKEILIDKKELEVTLDPVYVNVTGDIMTSTLNIQSDTDVQELIVKAKSGQTANLTEWQNSSGTVLACVDESGNVGIGTPSPANKLTISSSTSGDEYLFNILKTSPSAIDVLNVRSVSATNNVLYIGGQLMLQLVGTNVNYGDSNLTMGWKTNGVERMTLNDGGGLSINGGSDVLQLKVKANATQTANLTEWQNSSGTVLSAVQGRGTFISSLGSSTTNFFMGSLAGNGTNTGTDNFGLGNQALSSLTNGNYNYILGNGAGVNITSGSFNTAVGYQALSLLTTNGGNTAVGYTAGAVLTGTGNVLIGLQAGSALTSADNNTLIGYAAGYKNTTGDNNIYLGYLAGANQLTASNLLIIDNTGRASTTEESTNAILYGVMAATPANQTLRINAITTIDDDLYVGIADSDKAFFGAGADMSIYYDGTNAIINPREVGTGNIHLASALARRYYHLALGSANPGGSGATWVNADANTTGGWRLTNASWLLRGQADIHSDWDGASDPMFSVNFMVNVNNTGGGVGDTVDLKATVYYKGIGDTATKSQVVEVATVVGQSAQYKQFKANFTINWDETSNVVEAGDVIAVVLNLETDTSEVDDVVITSMELYYNTTHTYIESGDI